MMNAYRKQGCPVNAPWYTIQGVLAKTVLDRIANCAGHRYEERIKLGDKCKIRTEFIENDFQ
jgi:hypothetical protein